MDYSSEFPVFLAFAALTWGAFFGALGNKLVAINYSSRWRNAYYALGGVSMLVGVAGFLVIEELKLLDWGVLIMLVISGLVILYFTWKVLHTKDVFQTAELASKINGFTELADRGKICLLGGDLDFFGETESDMDDNDQYKFLKNKNFTSVSILCEEPIHPNTKTRYGKILRDIRGTELGFYNPKNADLNIRGRITTRQGVPKMLIYSKLETNQYKAIETDTANSNGALYSNIWGLAWSLATKMTPEEVQRLKDNS